MRIRSRWTAAAALLACVVLPATAAVEVNQVTLPQLEVIKGIGPDLAEAILTERDKAPFASWDEFVRRVRGVGPTSAARLSAAGLTVNGQPFPGAAASRRTPAPPPVAP